MTDYRKFEVVNKPHDIPLSMQLMLEELNRILVSIQMDISKIQGLDDFTPEFATSPTLAEAGVEDIEAVRVDQIALLAAVLTASRLVASDASGNLVSVANLATWIAGTANEITVTNDGDGTITLSLVAQAAEADLAAVSVTDPADAPADADALRDDLVANAISEIRTTLGNHVTKINNLLAKLRTTGIIST